MQGSLPYDIALKIASSLQVRDVCALGSCCRFWRELCRADCIWESLVKVRWPFLALIQDKASSSATTTEIQEIDQDVHFTTQGWRRFYVKRHDEIAVKTATVIEFVERCSLSKSLEVGDYLKAMEELRELRLGFLDVKLFLFQPKLSVLLNLVGLHYCINWLQVPAEYVAKALESSDISERNVCIKWWILGRWLYGFRTRDECHSRLVALEDLATRSEEGREVLSVLQRGAIHEVFRVQISTFNPVLAPWSCQCTGRL